MRTRLSRFMILLLGLFVLTPASFAQFSQRGNISGVVTEASGAVVPQASVSLLDLGRNQTSTTNTDASGHYQFPQLLPGSYQSRSNVRDSRNPSPARWQCRHNRKSAATFSSNWPQFRSR